MTQKPDTTDATTPEQIGEEALDQAKGGLNMVGIVDPNQMQDLAEPTPTLEDYGKDVLYGGHGHDHMVWKD